MRRGDAGASGRYEPTQRAVPPRSLPRHQTPRYETPRPEMPPREPPHHEPPHREPPHHEPPRRRLGRRSFLAGGGALVVAAGVGWALADPGASPLMPRLRPLPAEGLPASWRGGGTWDWRDFREVPVSMTDNKIRLTSHRGVGTALGVGGRSVDDRRLYVRRDLQATDVEVSAEFATALPAQFGLAMRVQPGVAVVVWQNIYQLASANVLQGTWQFGGDQLLATNVGGAVPGFVQPVTRAVGDGATVVVTTPTAHRLRPGDIVRHGGDLAGFGTAQIDETPSLITYTFASPREGTWTSGTIQRVTIRDRRHLAARLVGDQVSFKQWLPGEPEPVWDDVLRVGTTTLPDELAGGAGSPTGPGGAGIVVAHLGDGGKLDVADLHVRVLA